MCLLAVACGVLPDVPLIVAANRDEFHARPTAAAALWDDAPDLLAGRDLEAGGTWLGVTVSGRFAALTNYRGPARRRDEVLTRGALVADYLRGRESPGEYLQRVAAEPEAYNGFNLLVGEAGGELRWYSNVARRTEVLAPGVHGLSNALLDTPWPKVVRTRRGLAELVAAETGAGEPEPGRLLALLADRERAPDADLPDTGVGLEWERLLSAPFIVSPLYGTRSSTVVLLSRSGTVTFVERSFDPAGEITATRSFRLS